jgi:hypothetical protein
MKTLILPCLLVLFSFQALLAQNYKNGTLTDINNTTFTGQFSIDHQNALLLYRDGQTSRAFGYSQIQSFSIDGQNVVVKQVNNQNVLLTELVSGKATLYEKNQTLFYIENQKDFIEINTSENTFLIPGKLNLVFSDCNSIREPISKVSNFNKSALVRLTEQYNLCDYNEGFELTEKEIRESERFRTDVFSFYAGAGITFSNLGYKDAEKNTIFPQLSLGVLVSPGFLGNLQHKLHFGTDVSYGFGISQNLSATNENLDVKLHSFVYAFESQFHFNTSNYLQPFIGGGVNFHSDRYKGVLNGEDFNSLDGRFNYTLKAGVVLNAGKNRLGLSLRYIPEFTSDASFINSEGTYTFLDINNSYFITRVEFYF